MNLVCPRCNGTGHDPDSHCCSHCGRQHDLNDVKCDGCCPKCDGAGEIEEEEIEQ